MKLEELRKEALKLGRTDAKTMTESALKVFINSSKKINSVCKSVLKSELVELAKAADINPMKSTGKPKTKYELCVELESKNKLQEKPCKPKLKKLELEKSIQKTLEAEYKEKLEKVETLIRSLEVKEESLTAKERVLKEKESVLEQERDEIKRQLNSRLEEELRKKEQDFIKILKEKDAVFENYKNQKTLELQQDAERLKETEETLLKQAELIKESEDSRIKREDALRKKVKYQTTEVEKTREKYLSELEKLKEKEKAVKTTVLEQLKKERKKVGKLTDDEVRINLYENPYFERLFKDAVSYLLETDDPSIHRTVTLKEIIQTTPHQRFIDYAKKQFNIQTTKFNSKDEIFDKMLQIMLNSAKTVTDLPTLPKVSDEEELNADLAVFDIEKTDEEEEKALEMKQKVLEWPVRQLDVNAVDKLLTEIQSTRTTTTDLVKVQKIIFNALGLIN